MLITKINDIDTERSLIPMQPRPIADTAGPFDPGIRVYMTDSLSSTVDLQDLAQPRGNAGVILIAFS